MDMRSREQHLEDVRQEHRQASRKEKTRLQNEARKPTRLNRVCKGSWELFQAGTGLVLAPYEANCGNAGRSVLDLHSLMPEGNGLAFARRAVDCFHQFQRTVALLAAHQRWTAVADRFAEVKKLALEWR